ncbi:hypothetical protein HH212_06430 [Massilia forsythiae]|uniref:DNA mismatch repair protein MutS n=1 Tax=Massilia forsythiae TaxID=2728020 RepID=A0A7Z2ZRR7_9BURK|nr:hypothetical protein [Massilia forsythiae]QJD99710.1 hypothetical protein HH212_06430 [Massilia forsythiae]
MSSTVFRLLGAWRPVLSRLAGWLKPAEPEPQDVPFSEADIARLYGLGAQDADGLDDQTWRDLLLDRYGAILFEEVSIFGRQALYRRLRIGSSEADLATRRARIEALLADPDAAARLQRMLRSLRHADSEVAGLLFDPGERMPAPPAWLRWWFLLPLGLLASIAAALLVSPAAWLSTAAVMAVLVSAQMRHGDAIGAWQRKTLSLQMLLRTCSLLDAGQGGFAPSLTAGFDGRGATAGRINRSLPPSMLGGQVPGMREYGDWFLLANVRHFYKTLGIVFAWRDFLGECYSLCADLEADLALVRHLRGLGGRAWCWAQRSGARALALEDGVHPLIDGGMGLSIALDGKGAFISGQNGVGKSTLLRMLGLNLAAARAFGFCYARRASLPALPVFASMQNEDSLLGGQSLYIAELARARALLAAAQDGRPVVCLVDEIFRGTNYEESVSAAAAVLDELSQHALVVVSSHNLVLGPLLAHRLAPWRVARDAGGALRLAPGVLGRTNGVALLADHGFAAAVCAKAASVAGWMAGQRHAEVGADLLARASGKGNGLAA